MFHYIQDKYNLKCGDQYKHQYFQFIVLIYKRQHCFPKLVNRLTFERLHVKPVQTHAVRIIGIDVLREQENQKQKVPNIPTVFEKVLHHQYSIVIFIKHVLVDILLYQIENYQH